MNYLAVLAAALVLAGCVSPPAAQLTLPPGRWGGDQIALEVRGDGSGLIEMSCATADFAGPVKIDVGGHFLAEGRFVRGTGVATIDPPPSVPAMISGRFDPSGLLWLDIALRNSYPLRSAQLRRGAEPNLVRCL